IYSYPEGWTGPGAPWVEEIVSIEHPDGTALVATLFVYLGNTPPPAFVVAPSSPDWGKFLFSLQANGGVKFGAQHPDLNDRSAALSIPSPGASLEGLAWREGEQFGTEIWKKWAGAVQRDLVKIDGLFSTAVASFAVTAPIINSGGATAPNVGISAATAIAPGSMSAAHYTAVNTRTSAATVSTMMERDGSGRAKVAAPSASDDIATKSSSEAAATAAAQNEANWRLASALLSDDPSFALRYLTDVQGIRVIGDEFNIQLSSNGYLVVSYGVQVVFSVDKNGIGFFGHPASGQVPNIGALTDSTGGAAAGSSVAAIPDPANSPATPDGLRDDLVLNTIPAIRDAIAKLTAKVNLLNAALEAHGLVAL
ncbi:MAG TPA: hypothetical protein VK459_09005, partial [Polyangiaceae bacterium]|nr:hypothetical protein [Polyangiaceae bacterium]